MIIMINITMIETAFQFYRFYCLCEFEPYSWVNATTNVGCQETCRLAGKSAMFAGRHIWDTSPYLFYICRIPETLRSGWQLTGHSNACSGAGSTTTSCLCRGVHSRAPYLTCNMLVARHRQSIGIADT